MEYAASIWDPHLAKECDLLEKLKRRSARFDLRGLQDNIQCVPGAAWSCTGVTLKTAGRILDWLWACGH